MQTRRLLLLVLLAASALLVAGCTQAPTAPPATATPAPTAAATATPAPGSDAVKMVNGVQQVTIEMSEFKFTPSDLTLKAGKTQITVPNKGAVPHELLLLNAQDPAKLSAFIAAHKKEMAGGPAAEDAVPGVLVVELEDVDAGQSKTSDVLDLSAGPYVIVCLVPGHYEAGMKGTITVA